MTSLPGARPAVTDGALFTKLLRQSGSGEAKIEVCRGVLRAAAAEIPPRRATAEECYEALAADPTVFDGTLEKARLIILTGQWKRPDEPIAPSIEDELLAPGCPILPTDADEDDDDRPRAFQTGTRPAVQSSATMGPLASGFGMSGELARPRQAGPQAPYTGGNFAPGTGPNPIGPAANLDRPRHPQHGNPSASSPGPAPDGTDAGGAGGPNYGTHAVGVNDPSKPTAGPVPGDNVRTLDATGPAAGVGTPVEGSASAESSRTVPLTGPVAGGDETGGGDEGGNGDGGETGAGNGEPPEGAGGDDKDKPKGHGGRHGKRK